MDIVCVCVVCSIAHKYFTKWNKNSEANEKYEQFIKVKYVHFPLFVCCYFLTQKYEIESSNNRNRHLYLWKYNFLYHFQSNFGGPMS